MVKLVALYKKPADVDAFEKHYTEIHAPLAQKMPGLRKLEVSRFTGSPGGEPKFYLMAEMYFDDKGAMFAALSSDEGKEVDILDLRDEDLLLSVVLHQQ